jgi:DNA-binding CsgD family transcriptional regulator
VRVPQEVVGRELELAAVERALATGDAGPVLVLLEGEAGIGKTTVWREGVRGVRARGWTVLACRPAQSEARFPFAGLADLLEALPEEQLAALPSPQRHALEVALLRAAPSGRAPDRRLIGTALLAVLRQAAEERTLLLAIDDVQWLDQPSVGALEFALRRLADERIAVLLATRPDPRRSRLAAAFAEERTHRVALRVPSVAALYRIVAERIGLRLPRPTLLRVVRAAGGNPFYTLEIARLLARDGIPGHGEALPLPDDLRALAAGRIRALPASTRVALLLAAAATRPTLALVDAADLAPAEEAGLVQVATDGRIELAHPLFASAVYGAAPAARRRDAHLTLAAAVSDPEERARHLALAADRPDEQTAALVAAAARSALARGAPDAAAELTELAVRLTPTASPAGGARRLALAEQLHLAGDLDRATRVLEDLRTEVAAGDLRARVLLALSELLFRRAGESAATSLAAEALEFASDPVVRARCLSVLSNWAGTHDLERAAAAAREALELLDGVDAEPGLVSFTLANRVRADLFLGRGLDVEAAERALALESAAPPAAVDERMVYRLGQWLRYTDDLASARRRLEEAEQAALDEGDESSLINILLNRVLAATWAGSSSEAGELAARLGETGEQLGIEAGRLWQAYLDAHLGRLAAVREAAAQADRSEPVVDMLYLRSLGLVELSAGEVAAADEHLSRALDILDASGIREPAVWRIEGEAIDAAIANGRLEAAESRLVELERQAARSGIPWSRAVSRRGRGLLLAARGDLDGAAEALEQALVEHERSPVPFERARTLLALGRVRRRRKERRLAQQALSAALALFEELGSSLWAERAREDLARVTTRSAPEGLTATEREIARLAAEGLTNRQIADRVFVTSKTVEANLARAYRKLGITSRAQLARALGDVAP